MINLDDFEPYNSTECIDRLMEVVKEKRLFLNEQIIVDVMIRIRKLKVQLYFKERAEVYNEVLKRETRCDVDASEVIPKKATQYSPEGKPRLKTRMDVDRLLQSASEDTKEALRKKMEYVRRIDSNDTKLKNYFIRKLTEMIRQIDDMELIENAKNAKHTRKEFERRTPNDEFHQPHLIYYPAGGQNKKY